MNAQQVWQAQAAEAPRISLEYVRHRASSLERRMRRRNGVEYAVGVFAMGVFVFTGLQHVGAKPIMLAAHAWFVLWSLFYMYYWHRFAASQSSPAEAGILDTLRYQRRQLERQRDARRRSWRWWAVPVAPGFVLMLVSMVVEADPVPWGGVAFLIVWMVIGTGLGIWFLEHEAGRYQREIDALDSLAAP